MGDAAVMLPLAGMLTFILMVAGIRPWPWVISVVGVTAFIGLSKICHYWGGMAVGNPSGHTALSVLILGGYARYAPLIAVGPRHVMAIRMGLGVLAMAIGVSRVALGAHGPGEAAMGALFACPWVVWLSLTPLPPVRSRLFWWIAVIAVVAVCYGVNLSVDPGLADWAQPVPDREDALLQGGG